MIIRKYGLTLTRLRKEDLELVRSYRNRPDIRSNMFYQGDITKEQQLSWFESVNNIYNYYFLIEKEGKKVGLINGKNIDYEKGISEGGIFLWDRSQLGLNVAGIASVVMIEFTFTLFKFTKTVAEIKADNKAQLTYNKLLGYKKVEEISEEGKICMSLTASDFEKKGRRIVTALGKLNNDTALISWNDLDFSEATPNQIARLYKGLPRWIQDNVDRYI